MIVPFDFSPQSSLDCLSFDNPLLLAALTSLGEVAFLVPSVFEENARSTAYEFVMEDLLPKDRVWHLFHCSLSNRKPPPILSSLICIINRFLENFELQDLLFAHLYYRSFPGKFWLWKIYYEDWRDLRGIRMIHHVVYLTRIFLRNFQEKIHVYEIVKFSSQASAKAKDGKNEWCDDCDVSRETQAKVRGRLVVSRKLACRASVLVSTRWIPGRHLGLGNRESLGWVQQSVPECGTEADCQPKADRGIAF